MTMGPSWTSRPFALFVLIDTDEETLNSILENAESGTSTADFWLVSTSDYSLAPTKEGNKVNLGTSPPIQSNFSSPFIGSTLEEVARWLRNKPEDTDLDSHHFGVVDKRSAVEGTVLLCKIGDKDLNGNDVTCRTEHARDAGNFLLGLEYGEWEQSLPSAKDTALNKVEY